MTTESPLSSEGIEERLQQVGQYSRFVRTSLLVIASGFLLALVRVVPVNLETPAQAIEAIFIPLFFVGLGRILYGIGMHLHLMHLNVIRQLQPADGEE